MPVTVKVNGTVNSLVHKGSNHISSATIPDVCKTPSPGGPIPIPYPNISQSATLDKGTTTVKADGGMMIATKGSEFSLSNGDNAGTAGGVKSSTFMKESTWILYSFDVKLDGNNACRLSDKKFQNHENTADLMGAMGAPVVVSPEEAALQSIMCECHKEVKPGPNDSCTRLGEKKHACCDEKIKARKGPPEIGGESGYSAAGSPLSVTRDQAKASGVLKGTSWPDACAMSNGKPTQFFDFKFICPDGTSYYDRKNDTVKFSRGTGTADGDFYFPAGRSQFDKYKKLGGRLKPPAEKDPKPLSSRSC